MGQRCELGGYVCNYSAKYLLSRHRSRHNTTKIMVLRLKSPKRGRHRNRKLKYNVVSTMMEVCTRSCGSTEKGKGGPGVGHLR